MRKSRILAGVGITAAALLALTACNSGTPGAAPGASEGSGDGAMFEVATDVSLEGSPTFDAITERGSVKVGVKEDQPGLGYLDPTTNERSGFDQGSIGRTATLVEMRGRSMSPEMSTFSDSQ